MTEEAVGIARRGFVWHELMSTDPERSERFYQAVAGIRVDALDSDAGQYRLLVIDGRPVGGIAEPPPGEDRWASGGPEAHWIAYLGTDDVNRSARTAEELGGQVLLPPVDIPGVGRAAVLRDPQGAAFGVFAPAS